MRKNMFIDEITVHLKAGLGGNGCVSFRREKYIPKGGPNGGDGGKGGDVILICDHNLSDLNEFHFKNHYSAKEGEAGKGSQCSGKDGSDCELRLPPGTIVYGSENHRKVAELVKHGQKIVLLKGGKGGLGNLHFKSSTNQAPRQFTPGGEPEEASFILELKTMADIGLVGFPNAGKSTLVNSITAARRKTGPYPFTTITPSVGVIEYTESYNRLTLADIPGLIEGAHQNKGLGHRFLRHIERCKILVIIIDMAGEDGREPWKDYKSLIEELVCYKKSLLEKPRLIAANKMDEPIALENLKKFKQKVKDIEIVPISCLSEEGLPELKQILLSRVRESEIKDSPLS